MNSPTTPKSPHFSYVAIESRKLRGSCVSSPTDSCATGVAGRSPRSHAAWHAVRGAGHQALDLGDGAIGHPAKRALPPGMGRADHPGGAIGQQHRGAIGGDNAEQLGGNCTD